MYTFCLQKSAITRYQMNKKKNIKVIKLGELSHEELEYKKNIKTTKILINMQMKINGNYLSSFFVQPLPFQLY